MNDRPAAEVLWLRRRHRLALHAIVACVEHDPEDDLAWQCLHEWSCWLAEPELGPATVRRLAANPNVNAWIAAARDLERGAQPQPLLPVHVRALAELGRAGEVLVARNLSPDAAVAEDPRPWLLARLGRRSEAIAALRKALRVGRAGISGARMLARWLAEHGTPLEHLEAAEAALRLGASDAGDHAQRGHARLRNGDKDGAQADLALALPLQAAPDLTLELLRNAVPIHSANDAAGGLLALATLTPDRALARRFELAAFQWRLADAVPLASSS